ncbi:hypothetical protein L3Q82_013725 [Scortum barcoo]|uniref:Uncharacterized protein n=1 Tax=Scortum barcoo TaxID=214431 RepID=A0ACB8W1N3_9TELE|nr:hypothetical protein L3Q82_013725 [Scortum barcoo]
MDDMKWSCHGDVMLHNFQITRELPRKEDYVQQGICEDVLESNKSAETESKITYYLSHHAVIREDKIQTASDCLHGTDTEKAFLQISLAERDRDVVRFIWLTGPPDAESTRPHVMRMLRVVFGVSSSPFLLAATIRNHLEKYKVTQPHAVNILKDSLYVNDLIASASNVEEAYALTAGAKEILADASMNLCKWTTNSPELKTKWLNSDLDFTQETEAHGCVLKVLGLIWRPDTDNFVFDLKHLMDILKGKGNTKRSVLRSSARIFDPIGFLTPFTITVKCLFQEMWRRGISWDEELPAELSEAWQQWCMELPQIHQIVIPKWYGVDKRPGDQS